MLPQHTLQSVGYAFHFNRGPRAIGENRGIAGRQQQGIAIRNEISSAPAIAVSVKRLGTLRPGSTKLICFWDTPVSSDNGAGLAADIAPVTQYTPSSLLFS